MYVCIQVCAFTHIHFLISGLGPFLKNYSGASPVPRPGYTHVHARASFRAITLLAVDIFFVNRAIIVRSTIKLLLLLWLFCPILDVGSCLCFQLCLNVLLPLCTFPSGFSLCCWLCCLHSTFSMCHGLHEGTIRVYPFVFVCVYLYLLCNITGCLKYPWFVSDTLWPLMTGLNFDCFGHSDRFSTRGIGGDASHSIEYYLSLFVDLYACQSGWKTLTHILAVKFNLTCYTFTTRLHEWFPIATVPLVRFYCYDMLHHHRTRWETSHKSGCSIFVYSLSKQRLSCKNILLFNIKSGILIRIGSGQNQLL